MGNVQLQAAFLAVTGAGPHSSAQSWCSDADRTSLRACGREGGRAGGLGLGGTIKLGSTGRCHFPSAASLLAMRASPAPPRSGRVEQTVMAASLAEPASRLCCHLSGCPAPWRCPAPWGSAPPGPAHRCNEARVQDVRGRTHHVGNLEEHLDRLRQQGAQNRMTERDAGVRPGASRCWPTASCCRARLSRAQAPATLPWRLAPPWTVTHADVAVARPDHAVQVDLHEAGGRRRAVSLHPGCRVPARGETAEIDGRIAARRHGR